MKIKADHFQELVQLMDEARQKMDKPIEEWIQIYRDLGRSTQRFAWDWMWSLEKESRTQWIRKVYDYADDDHVSTALKAGMKALGVNYVEPAVTRITPGSPMMCDPIKVVSNLDTARAHRETPNNDSPVDKCTIWIAPGNTQCRVYLLPYPMRPGQSPRDLAERFQRDWPLVAVLDHNLKAVHCEPGIRGILHEIEGQMGGTFFDVPRQDVASLLPPDPLRRWCIVDTQNEDTPDEQDVILVKGLTEAEAEVELQRQINGGAESAYIGETEDYELEMNASGEVVEIKKAVPEQKGPDSTGGFEPSM